MNDLSGNLSNVANNAKNVASELKSIADAALKSTSGVFEFVHAAEWADSTNTLRDQTGISVDQLQRFEFATQQIDVSIDTITTSIARLTRNMNSAKDGAGSAAEAFKTLGVDVVDSDGNLNNSIETFYKLIDALADVENETERDALSMTLFGKNAMQLNPLIKGGADTLKKLGDEAERAGLILDQGTLNSLHAFNDEIDTLKSKGNQIKRLIAVEAQPAVQDLVNVSDKLLDELKAMADSGELANIAKNTAGTITNLAEALKNLTLFLIRHKDIVAGAVAGYAAFKVSLSIAQLVYALANAFKSLKTATDAAAMAQAFFDKTLYTPNINQAVHFGDGNGISLDNPHQDDIMEKRDNDGSNYKQNPDTGKMEGSEPYADKVTGGVSGSSGKNVKTDDRFEIHPDKINKFLLKPGAKHSKEFFDVGYKEDDYEKLFDDIAKSYDRDKAIDFRPDKEQGKDSFSIFMNLGITEQKQFRTVWEQSREKGSKPRLITAHRED